MGYDSNTKTLIRPLNTENIRACLGENSLSIKNLACSSLINPKSKYKPMRYPKPVNGESESKYYPELDKAQQDSVNYGIVIKSYSLDGEGGSKLINTMSTEIINSLNLTDTTIEGKAFYYDRLSGDRANDIGRYTDFFGYRHLAGDWVVPTFAKYGVAGSAECSLRLNYEEALERFNDLLQWDAFKNLSGTLYFGFIMKRKGGAWNGDSKFYCILAGEDINQLDGQLIDFTPVANSAGEWDIYPVIAGGGLNVTANSMTSFSELGSVGTFVPMPYAPFATWKIGKVGSDNESGEGIDLFNLLDYLNVDISANATILDVGVARINGVTANITVTKNAETTKVPTFAVSSMTVSSDMQGATELVGTMTHFNEPTNVTEGNGIVVSIMAKEGEEENATRVTYESFIYLTINYSDSFSKSYVKTYNLEIGK